MSRMAESKGRRPRRQFDAEFKAQAVRLVLQDGKSIGAVARDLDLTDSALRQLGRAGPGGSDGWPDRAHHSEREELARLRKENRELRTERDILKKAAAFFAKHQA